MKTKKITLATVKSFIRNNFDRMLINVKSEFDGMTDGCESRHLGFRKVEDTTEWMDHTHGIKQAWFVGDSRDYFTPYSTETLEGIEVSNCCSHFILAIEK